MILQDLADGWEEEEGDEGGPRPMTHEAHTPGVTTKLSYVLLKENK